MQMIRRRQRGPAALGIAVALAVGVTTGAAASPVHLGGVDLLTSYTAPTTTTDGLLSFGASPGNVTSADDVRLTGIIGGAVTFQALLDAAYANSILTGGNPHSNAASFGSTGAAPEMLIFDPSDGVTVLLAFQLVSLDVSQFVGATDQIILGNLDPQSTSSLLTVAGGTLAAAHDWTGKSAILEFTMNDLSVNAKGRPSVWASDFTNTNTTWNLVILTAPEPGTALLLGAGLAGLASATVRRRPRR